MNVKVVLNPINVTNPVIMVVEYVYQPGATVFQQLFNPPHAQRNFTVIDLEPVMCRFFFWESLNGVDLDQLLGSADIDAGIGGDAMLEVLEFVVDRNNQYDPVDGDITISHPSLLGAVLAKPGVTPAGPVYQVSERGVGLKLSDEIDDSVDGAFTLQGDKFSSGDSWIVNIYKRLVSTTGSVMVSFFQDIVHKDVDFAIDEGLYNKKICLDGAAPVQTVTFPALVGILNKRFFLFDTHGAAGTLNYAAIKFTSGGLRYNGALWSTFWMARGEELAIAVDGNETVVLWYKGNANDRGLIKMSYTDRVGHVRAIGTKLLKADYPALYDHVFKLPPGVAVPSTSWVNVDLGGQYNRCRWGIDTTPGAEFIYVPDLRQMMPKALKLGVNPDPYRADDISGGIQNANVGDHDHKKSRQATKRGGATDPSGEAWKTPIGTTFGAAFDDGPGPVVRGPGIFANPENTVLNYGQIPLITL